MRRLDACTDELRVLYWRGWTIALIMDERMRVRALAKRGRLTSDDFYMVPHKEIASTWRTSGNQALDVIEHMIEEQNHGRS